MIQVLLLLKQYQKKLFPNSLIILCYENIGYILFKFNIYNFHMHL